MLNWILISTILFAQESNWNVNKKGIVADSYDVVSYFTGAPQKGKEQFAYRYNGATFYFHDGDNLKRFIDNPDQYVPQYGGWCAYAMAISGDKVSIDPETYTITDGKLYLFYNRIGNNTLTLWKEDEENFIVKSSSQWRLKYQPY